MAINPADYYGDLADAITYFTDRWHERDFLRQTDDNQERILLAATRAIDRLSFSGYKTPVYDLLKADPDATIEDIEAASATQPLQFPRGVEPQKVGDTTVPQEIIYATWELSHELARGRDPGMEYENLILTSDGAGSTRTSMDRSRPAPAHLRNGIVSFEAWRWLMPFLADNNTFRKIRTS